MTACFVPVACLTSGGTVCLLCLQFVIMCGDDYNSRRRKALCSPKTYNGARVHYNLVNCSHKWKTWTWTFSTSCPLFEVQLKSLLSLQFYHNRKGTVEWRSSMCKFIKKCYQLPHILRGCFLEISQLTEYSLWHIKINKCRLCHQWYTAVKLWFSDKTAYILFLPAVLSVKSWNNLWFNDGMTEKWYLVVQIN